LFARYSLKHYTNSGEACQQFNKIIILPSVPLSYDFVSTPSITYSAVFYPVLERIFHRRYSLLAGGLRVFLSRKKPGKRAQKSVWGEIFALIQDGAGDRFAMKNTLKPPSSRLPPLFNIVPRVLRLLDQRVVAG